MKKVFTTSTFYYFFIRIYNLIEKKNNNNNNKIAKYCLTEIASMLFNSFRHALTIMLIIKLSY